MDISREGVSYLRRKWLRTDPVFFSAWELEEALGTLSKQEQDFLTDYAHLDSSKRRYQRKDLVFRYGLQSEKEVAYLYEKIRLWTTKVIHQVQEGEFLYKLYLDQEKLKKRLLLLSDDMRRAKEMELALLPDGKRYSKKEIAATFGWTPTLCSRYLKECNEILLLPDYGMGRKEEVDFLRRYRDVLSFSCQEKEEQQRKKEQFLVYLQSCWGKDEVYDEVVNRAFMGLTPFERRLLEVKRDHPDWKMQKIQSIFSFVSYSEARYATAMATKRLEKVYDGVLAKDPLPLLLTDPVARDEALAKLPPELRLLKALEWGFFDCERHNVTDLSRIFEVKPLEIKKWQATADALLVQGTSSIKALTYRR